MSHYRIAHILVAVAAFAMLLITTLPSAVQAEPRAEAWISTGRGWVRPPIGGPVNHYVYDLSTGKKYLVEMDYWGNAKISNVDLNAVDLPDRAGLTGDRTRR